MTTWKQFAVLWAMSAIMGALSVSASGEDELEMQSPSGRYAIEVREQRLPGADTFDDRQLVILDRGQVVSRHPFAGEASPFWSPDEQWLAINNRWANGGDCVWIFSLPHGRALKKVRDKLGQQIEREGLESIRAVDPTTQSDSIRKSRIDVIDWAENDVLKVRLIATLRGAQRAFTYSPDIEVSPNKLTLGEAKAAWKD